MAFRWIFGADRIARLRAAGFTAELANAVTLPTPGEPALWAAGGEAFRTWPTEVLDLVQGNLAHDGITDADIVPVVHVDESSMHYVLLVDGRLLDVGEEWLEPIAGGVRQFVAETLIAAWERDAFDDDELVAWAASVDYPHAAQLLKELPVHNGTQPELAAWLADFLARTA